MPPGVIAGVVIGVLMLWIGLWAIVQSEAKGPRERAFGNRVFVAYSVAMGALMAGVLLLPRPWGHFLMTPFFLLQMFAIRYLNRMETRIRDEEASHDSAAQEPSQRT